MKKKEKILILVLAIITIALIAFAVIRNVGDDETNDVTLSETADSTETSSDDEDEEEEATEGAYYTTLEDGTKLNTSSKLNEDKEIDGIQVTDIQLTESNNVTQILATLTNTSEETKGGYVATLTLYDEAGEVLVELKPYIAEIAAGESTQLNVSAVFDYTEAYDFTITK